MIDHIGIIVTDFPASRAFYEKALAPVGYAMLMELGPEITGTVRVAGFGEAQKPDFWISEAAPGKTAGNTVHVALRVTSRAQVDAFHAAALQAGGRDNGAPGIRAHYHPNYYGAFVLDPDGHNIEAVCHDPV
ncbi:VOC family protein [Pseudoduganella sp. SL102]|uniref:Glyoxalase n=1 Tax=Pseudoduganella albidiflava TaxID=321983 RepID=A0A411X1T7_9BURK|nr:MULTISPECIES: VOC family protein [Pseudoduganella]QBI02937.1 VOC family protein [Pseudoduganella albidiflava]WBS04567.1 VOC family protein [Pseudoduganella sp. SL102]GGY57489.1 glyoxalase [Pseudoduganella albidiflava]